jgi:membrane associated rhomboid family serine protease
VPLIPLKDDVPTARPPVAILVLMVANVAAYFAIDGGGLSGALVPLVVNVLTLWIYGATIEFREGRLVAVAIYGAGVALGVVLSLVLSDGASAAAASAGGTGAIAATHLVRHPRSQVLGPLLIPLFVSIQGIPSALFLALWAGAQVVFATVGAIAPAGDIDGSAYLAAALAPLAIGAVAGLALRRRGGGPGATSRPPYGGTAARTRS